jgi:hypothetical protein
MRKDPFSAPAQRGTGWLRKINLVPVGPKGFPPILHPSVEVIYLSRVPQTQSITFWMPNGDTYDTSPEVARQYLKLCGVTNELYLRVIDYVWDFYSCRFNIRSGRFVWVPMEELDEGRIWRS